MTTGSDDDLGREAGPATTVPETKPEKQSEGGLPPSPTPPADDDDDDGDWWSDAGIDR